MKSTAFCSGCTDDFYNGKNSIGVKRCWLLDKAKVVTRWKIGWWDSPVIPGAFVEVKTYNCHREPGKFAFCENLPSHAVEPVRIKKANQ